MLSSGILCQFQTPDDGFRSINKLAGYLTGTKKSEMKEDDEDTESRNLPPPKPVTTKKKDIVGDSPAVFKHVDEHARQVSFKRRYRYRNALSRKKHEQHLK